MGNGNGPSATRDDEPLVCPFHTKYSFPPKKKRESDEKMHVEFINI